MFGKTFGFVKEYAPEIIFGIGVGFAVKGYFSAIRASKKCDEIVKKYDDDLEMIEKAVKLEQEHGEGKYTGDDERMDTYIAKRDKYISYAKLYARPAIFSLLGLSCMVVSNSIAIKQASKAFSIISAFMVGLESIGFNRVDETDDNFTFVKKVEPNDESYLLKIEAA